MKYPHALAASEIRKILKEKFPETKFSVRSQKYTGGDCVHIYYSGDPAYEEIAELVKDFQYGSFNKNTYKYEMNNIIDSIPQTKYVLIHRDV